ncbi:MULTISPECIES: carbohydrate ABC transporter permease [Sorangium]|uniref:Glycerol-3-phosphate ABC transporter permease n=1 Tax=Sorangium cellulosum TaxID=56 RepID=A0A4P2QYQ1_SORCE|nr:MULTISPECIES: sugar ABC transporter permease [Sorangium]AUX34703.1 glycerol-3-phosphate ABC transporter permease [Sorangium cellulosum]WCQ94015.1 Lactose transport system permease protein LacF [Sorangium sp. Soce836]
MTAVDVPLVEPGQAEADGGAQSAPGVGRLRERGFTRPRRWAPYLFLAPYLALFGLFVATPIALGVWISLHDWDPFLPSQPWVGLDNYADLFRSGSPIRGNFWRALRATALFTALSVPVLVTLPLLLALALNQRFPGRSFFRAMFFAPYVLGVAVVAMIWRLLLDPQVGAINHLLAKVGLPSGTGWTTAVPWVWVSLVGMTVWWTLGYNAVIYLAGLQNIHRELYDAARIDGATRWQQFWHVTIPGLRPVFVFVVTMTVLASANMFGQAYLVTGGGPGSETRTTIMYIADEGFRSFRLGAAAAMSYVQAFFLAVVSLVMFLLFFGRGSDEDAP